MTWPGKDAITNGVISMLRVNMGLKDGESLLVIADVPNKEEWQKLPVKQLQNMLERAVMARLVADVAKEQFPACEVSFATYDSTGKSGTEPPAEIAGKMKQPNVVLAPATHSISHTNARQKATDAGVRLASMPGFEASMLEEGGPMSVDYRRVAHDCKVVADALAGVSEVVVRTPHGTDLRFGVKGRPAETDDGIYDGEGGPHPWGNLPAGETYTAPLEGTAEGVLVAPAGWFRDLEEDMTFRFEKGEVVELTGGGAVGDHFRELLQIGKDDPVYRARRNLAELGIGTNPNARRPDNTLEAEKIKGTVHIAIGDNIHMGGRVEADLHEDFVLPQPDLIIDGKAVMVAGEWFFET